MKRPLTKTDLETAREGMLRAFEQRWPTGVERLAGNVPQHCLLDAVAILQEEALRAGCDGTFSLGTLRWLLTEALEFCRPIGTQFRLTFDRLGLELVVHCYHVTGGVDRVGTVIVPARRVYDISP